MRHLAASLAFVVLSTVATSAQTTYSCPGGATPIVVPGFGTYCPATPNTAPEIHTSSALNGAGLLLCTAIMLLPRKRKHTSA